MITTTDPRTGRTSDTSLEQTSADEVGRIADAAAATAVAFVERDRSWRADLLDAVAAEITRRSDDLVRVADAETGLGAARLASETARSAAQFAMFARAVRDGGFLEAAIDHAETTELGPQPDVRRLMRGVGPVAVFGSSNFPFAFSVLGGDTASALAAGCPVVIKAHGSHPLTSELSFEVLQAALGASDAPEAVAGIVYGQPAGSALVAHPAITAVGFTGSLSAAQALMEVIRGRETPIPFYGELSSVNPLVVTRAAASARADEIARGLHTSFTGSAGQLCTKPGLAFVPRGPEGDALVDALAALADDSDPGVLLNRRIHTAFDEIRGRLVAAGARVVTAGDGSATEGFRVAPAVLTGDVEDLGPDLAEECFGPLIVVLRYDEIDQVGAAIARIPRSLTTSVHAEPGDDDEIAPLLGLAAERAGRVLYNGYPTGVRVSWAQTHGGPWPATTNQATSVGVGSMGRWLRPVTWQNFPQRLLPAELRDGAAIVPRREDGRLVLPA